MRRLRPSHIIGCLVVFTAALYGANYADGVMIYRPGQNAGMLTNSTVVLGPPSHQTEDPQWGTFPVDPFSPPYLPSQLVVLGEGGSLVLRFEQPVLDHPGNPHGLDFIVFGNAFFNLNSDWTTTSGSLGGTNTGITRISVSVDGQYFYPLATEWAPAPDHLFPTDHAGDPHQPVDPALTAASFAGRDVEGIRELYAGSAGGTGYDLAWARDAEGNPVKLPFIRFVQFEQVSGEAQFDAVSAVAPGNIMWTGFEADPRNEGWRVAGDPALFTWDPGAEQLRVTWDSSKTNSYFHRPLSFVLTPEDDFALGLDLRLESIAIGVDPAKPFTFQVAFGLIQTSSATAPDFFRGTGVDSVHGPRNMLEFGYFPDSGFGATVSPVLISSDNQFASSFNFPVELDTDATFNVVLRYTSSDRRLRTTLTREHMDFAAIQDVVLPAEFAGFNFDAVAVSSFSDAGQHPQFGGSILAHGTIDNLFMEMPPPPIHRMSGVMTGEGYRVTFSGKAGWTYTLERSQDLGDWQSLASQTASETGIVALEDLSPASPQAYYRVGATR